ncbi:MAG: GtrA family protein [Clostridiales bacterium]|nr:GtrA family protein [Clostridiales bacterium]
MAPIPAKNEKGTFKRLLKRILNRETILYAVFGVATSLENVALFQTLLWTGLDYKVGNIITLVVVKLTAYVLNKLFVFRSHCKNFGGLCMEVLRFVLARGATMLVDYFGLIFLVEVLHADKLIGKVIVTALVIILNYILGKLIVFKDGPEQ